MFRAKGNLARIGNRAIVAVMHKGFFGVNHVVRIMLDDKFTKDVLRNLQHKEGKPVGTIADKSIALHKIEIKIY